jgi:hypothetical protein
MYMVMTQMLFTARVASPGTENISQVASQAPRIANS